MYALALFNSGHQNMPQAVPRIGSVFERLNYAAVILNPVEDYSYLYLKYKPENFLCSGLSAYVGFQYDKWENILNFSIDSILMNHSKIFNSRYNIYCDDWSRNLTHRGYSLIKNIEITKTIKITLYTYGNQFSSRAIEKLKKDYTHPLEDRQ